MSRAWRIIGTVILLLVIAGVVSGGIGLLTGASLDRMVENVFGGREGLEAVLNVFFGALDGILPGQYGVSFVVN